MKQTQVKELRKEGQASYGIQVTTHDDKFVIPVIDVRDGDDARRYAKHILKQSNGIGGKHMKQTFSLYGHSYQVSQKKS